MISTSLVHTRMLWVLTWGSMRISRGPSRSQLNPLAGLFTCAKRQHFEQRNISWKAEHTGCYLSIKPTCIDDIPKSINMPSTPEDKSCGSTRARTTLVDLKFSTKVKAFDGGCTRVSKRVLAASWATGSTSIPIKSFSSGWPLIICKTRRFKTLNHTWHTRNQESSTWNTWNYYIAWTCTSP